MIGTRLAHYEISGHLGTGGMGEVYQATDSKLGRNVAIKLLPEAFAHDIDRAAPFEREARTLASLNHPNIAAIYGLEESGGQKFLVMELVPGVTLAERIKRGSIPMHEALEIAKQIAAALEAAHAKGVIHRDLKPGNVMVKPDGSVKVLDFGLAKIAQADSIGPDDPTGSPSLTEAGVIVGTAAYMAPEQAEGKPVDKRVDIWAFGVTLFELLAGQRLFNGSSTQDTLVQVLSRDPDLSCVPLEFRLLLRQCLQRDPNQRLRDIGDAMSLVGNSSLPDNLRNDRLQSRSYWGWAVTALFAITTMTLAFLHFRESPAAAPIPVRFRIPFPEGAKPSDTPLFTLSPDGKTLAFSFDGGNGHRIWVRALDSLEPRPLVGPEVTLAAAVPFWSADSKSLMFYSEGLIKKADLSGGGVQTLCSVPGLVLGGSENRDHVMIFGTVTPSGIMKVPASGGTAISVTEVSTSGQERHAFPFFLPDGIHFLYVGVSAAPENTGLYVGSLDVAPKDQPRRRLLATLSAAEFVPGPNGVGKILFLRDSSLMAQDFDLGSLEIMGDPKTLVEGVGNTREFPYFAAASGNLVYRATPTQTSQMTWFDRKGQELSQVAEPMLAASAPMLNTTGSEFVISRWDSTDRNNDLFIYTLSPYHMLRLTRGPGLNESPAWSADGTHVAYASKRSEYNDLYQANTNGDGQNRALLESAESKFPDSWSRDGYLLYSVVGVSTGRDLWVLAPDGKAFPLLATPAREFGGRFSPDGRWVTYLSDESGLLELYARAFTPASGSGRAVIGPRIPISTGGANMPRWRADAREIFYTANGNLMAVPVAQGSNLQFGQPSVLFPAPAPNNWDAAPDGQSFLFAVPVGQQAIVPFTVVLNWQTTSQR